MEFTTLPDDALIKASHVRQLFGGISQDTLERRIKTGDIPQPQKLPGGRVNFWTVGAIRSALRTITEAA